jgi:hypothetical protein
MWGVADDNDVRWMLERLGPTPFRHFTDPTRASNQAAALPRTFVRFLEFPNPRFDQHAEMAQRTAGWRYRELAAPHHAPVTAPEQVSDLLLEVSL